MKLDERLNLGLTIASAMAMIAMMLHVVAHALSRSFLGVPLHGTNEVVTYWYLPIVALLGIPAAQLQKQHISVTLIVDRFGSRATDALTGFAYLLGGLMALGFAWFGLNEALDNMQTRATAGVTNIVIWPVFFLVPIVFSVLALIYILQAIFALRQPRAVDDVRARDRRDLGNARSHDAP